MTGIIFDAFVSRPTWTPPVFDSRLKLLYAQIEGAGLRPCTLGTTHAALRSPFDDMQSLMKRCKCTIVLGLPYLFIESGRIEHGDVGQKMTMTTEWNQIEAAVSLAMGMPTLILLHHTVAARGLFAKGAANVFVHQFDFMQSGWQQKTENALKALRAEVDASS